MQHEEDPGVRRAAVLDRRRFLRLTAAVPAGLAGALACAREGGGPSPTAGSSVSGPSGAAEGVPVPLVNDGINVQPLRRLDRDPDESEPVIVPELVALQLRAVYELGFDGMRIAAPFGDRSNFLAAIPYVRAARALGIDAVVVLSDFSGFVLARALHDAGRRAEVLRLYESVFGAAPAPVLPTLAGIGPGGVGRIAFQILNEPTHFLGIPPDVYVRELLRPCLLQLKRDDPEIIVVAAAEVGNVDGAPRIRAMLEAGLEEACDRIAYHVYSRNVIPLLSRDVRNFVWVTESGAAGTANHLPWVRDTFPEIRARIPDVSRIFYFQLFDADRGLYRLLDIERDGSGYRALVESTELYDYLRRFVLEAAAGQPLLGFDELIPDVRAYFPTAADVAAYDAVLEP